MAQLTHISKSEYCSGVQCPKMLWLKKHKPELFDNSILNQAILETGSAVGDLAMGLFGPFAEVKFGDLGEMIRETERLIAAGESIIAEASFSCEGLFCSVDILKNLGDKKVELYEVKSSTSVSEIYLHDVAFQVFVLEKCGFTVQKANLVYINNKYNRGIELEINKLFVIKDLTDTAREMQPEVEERIAGLKACISNPEEPAYKLGKNCFDPYDCGFWKYCSKDLPSPNIFDVSGMQSRTQFKYYDQGIISFEDLLKKADLNAGQKLHVQHALADLADNIEKDKVRDFLDTLSYPLYFLDFESFQPAIPLYENSWPFEQVTFQYSLHYYEEKGGELQHKEFLAMPGKDPRRELAEKLCEDIPLDVCTLAYNMQFEKTRIKELSKIYPDLADHLMNIHDNICDLMVPFQKKQYYTKAMQGSFSIKYVLPALFPNEPTLDYHNLEEVHNGSEASATFAAMEKMSPEELAASRANLLKYCELDTYAMVKVLEKLQEVTE